MLKVGKLYSCSEYYLMLYPDKATAAAVAPASAPADARLIMTAAYWTRELGKPVNYCDPKTPLLILSADKEYVEVLAGDKRGWIQIGHYPGDNRWDIKEIVNEAA